MWYICRAIALLFTKIEDSQKFFNWPSRKSSYEDLPIVARESRNCGVAEVYNPGEYKQKQAAIGEEGISGGSEEDQEINCKDL